MPGQKVEINPVISVMARKFQGSVNQRPPVSLSPPSEDFFHLPPRFFVLFTTRLL